MGLKFKRMTPDDAELLLKWRTHPEITKNMFTDLVNPSVESQRNWIISASQREDYRGYLICDDDTPIGFLCFADIDFHNQRCSTGSYIYERDARLKYGVTLHTYICNYVFHCLNLNKIVNYVMNANAKVLKIQMLHKTRLVGLLKEHILKNGEFHDVHVFEQLKSDWQSQKQHFSLEHIKAAYNDWK
ncbi:UDP-4-amino-4,6-dideoxy-N-acetyl-beta-L-altrosamine N-acetyltransferase [Shewanella submarina]|uniref:UDP-4-amino-4, 6-dideoxy-N-acetyl-beta-L-altrosamine N-acetyltransferase n=1 Tax=Shewanella submarina TaxID=2016376 RepID=A0ABV7GJ94_9GAMM|nr:UDP-4-amino-4,6-dideoxy-N-acetyl-beta-L-altrosamine N-acetyltransferase [Shewanella submarina]MCL1036430.1 UDP-4-amino-4,6-dideoxy-N-acetyl-beta-L-altrosamine N-acetyltransferase [Shewanella submarina]